MNALDEWRKRGDTKTLDALWRAACWEMSATERFDKAGAESDRKRAREILAEATPVESRPIYEDEDDKAREQFVSEWLEAQWPGHYVVKQPKLHTLDRRVYRSSDDALCGFFDVKTRWGRTFRTYRMSVKRHVDALTFMQDHPTLPARWYVAWPEGDRHRVLKIDLRDPVIPTLPISIGAGRTDRKDDKDVEDMYEVPIDSLEVVGVITFPKHLRKGKR